MSVEATLATNEEQFRSFRSVAKIWVLMGQKRSPEVLYGRLQSYTSFVASISGLIAGFTFVVTNTTLQFNDDAHVFISPALRLEIYGFFITFAFLCSLFALLLAATLHGISNMIGKENIVWFINEFRVLMPWPNTLMIISLVSMLIGSLVAMGGIYGAVVYWFMVSFAILLSLITLLIFLKIDGKAKKFAIERMKREKDWNPNDIELAGTVKDC